MSAHSEANLPEHVSRLAHFPITFFVIPMGMFGFTLATHSYEMLSHGGSSVSLFLLILSSVILALISGTYLVKCMVCPKAVAAEWNHPIRLTFFPAISVSYLLLAAALVDINPMAANLIWIAATTAQGIFTLAIVASWIGGRAFQHVQMMPTWFIPAVANVVVPLAGARLGYIETSWLFFSAGIFFWLILSTLIYNRLIFHDPIPAKLLPSLMIFIAPPAVAFVAWYRLTNEIGFFGHFLFSMAYVQALIVVTQLPKLRHSPFAMSWWALSFPTAALCIATLLFAKVTASVNYYYLGTALLVILSVIIILLLIRTAIAMIQQKICVPE